MHHAERTAARDDRRLVDRIRCGHVQADDGVTGLVIGGQLLFSSVMTMERRSAPIMTLSLASSNSSIVTRRLPRGRPAGPPR
jgi:hypothetical protein